MRHRFMDQIRRSRTPSILVALFVVLDLAITGGPVQARVFAPVDASITAVRTSTITLSPDVLAKATGGGTVLAKPFFPMTVASFGVNARRPVGFVSGGAAEGRINYDRHRNMADRHVNAPVIFMTAESTPMPPNNTGGDALLSGDCTAANAVCPAQTTGGGPVLSVLVYVKDVTDSGAGSDIFNIYFCNSPAGPITTFVPGAGMPGCDGPEGDVLRSGNIQIRGEAGITGEVTGTGAGAGAYATTPNVNGVELSGGTFGIGIRTAGPGDLEANLNGVQPLIGLFQQLTISGWITSASSSGGTITFSGTASMDMGDGSATLTGLAISGSLSATGLTLTVGSWSFGTLPVQDGTITVE